MQAQATNKLTLVFQAQTIDKLTLVFLECLFMLSPSFQIKIEPASILKYPIKLEGQHIVSMFPLACRLSWLVSRVVFVFHIEFDIGPQ